MFLSQKKIGVQMSRYTPNPNCKHESMYGPSTWSEGSVHACPSCGEKFVADHDCIPTQGLISRWTPYSEYYAWYIASQKAKNK